MQWKLRVRSNQHQTHPRWWKGSSQACVLPPHPRPTTRAKARARTRTITGITTNQARAAAAVGTTTARSTRVVTNPPLTALIKSHILKTKKRNVQRVEVIHTQKAAVAVEDILGTVALTTKAKIWRVVKSLRGAARP